MNWDAILMGAVLGLSVSAMNDVHRMEAGWKRALVTGIIIGVVAAVARATA